MYSKNLCKIKDPNKKSDRSYRKSKAQIENKLKEFAAAQGSDLYGFLNGYLTNSTINNNNNNNNIYNNYLNPYGNENDDFDNIGGNHQNNLNEEFTEEIGIIQSLWDDLGVTDTFKIIFENLCKDLDYKLKKDLLDNEISSLKKFSDALLVIKLFICLIFFIYKFIK